MRKKFLLCFLSALILSGAVFYHWFSHSEYKYLRPYVSFVSEVILSHHHIEHSRNRINHKVLITIPQSEWMDSFKIDQTPVTIGEYQQCERAGICSKAHYRDEYEKYYVQLKYRNNPVTYVTWNEANLYCQYAGGLLPTAFQWELAAGYGYDDRLYPWGDQVVSPARANIDHFYSDILPSGWLPYGASPYGVLDMAGNVREWVLDAYYTDEEIPFVIDSRSPDAVWFQAENVPLSSRVLKGGSDSDFPDKAEITSKQWHTPDSAGYNRGFRCAYHAD